MDRLEILAAVFGAMSVFLTVRRNIWCWPTGIVMVVLYMVVFWKAHLYSNMSLQVVFLALSVYGWFYWAGGTQGAETVAITRSGAFAYAGWFVAGLVGTAVLGTIATRNSDAAAPYWDAAVTSFSLVAQWLMSRKDVGSWAFWILVDVLAVALFAASGLYPTAILYGLFLALATAGLFEWLRAMRSEVRVA